MIHHVFANRSNIGDWLSARAIQMLVGEHVVEHLCDAPFVDDTLAALGALTDDDLVVIGGGGLLMDYFDPFWQGFEHLADRLRFCIWGVGLCDLKREDTRPPVDLIRPIVAKSQLTVVRDALTARAFGSDVSIAPCPSINLIEHRAPGFGILHVDAFDNVGDATYRAMETVAIEQACATGRPFKAINNMIAAGDDRELDATLEQYAAADLIITGRLHGCIIGLAMGRKVMAVSGDWKIESFMRAAGLRDWVCDIADTDALAQMLRALPTQRAPEAFLHNARLANIDVAAHVRGLQLNAASPTMASASTHVAALPSALAAADKLAATRALAGDSQ